ncbi:MAG: type II toxin-antitoxin system HicA family toxin [Thermomicrobiales bacterium]
MPRTPRVNGMEVYRALLRDGWYEVNREGAHVQMRHPTKPDRVTAIKQRGTILKVKTLRSMLDAAGLTDDDLRRLL